MQRFKIDNSQTRIYYSTCTITAWLPVFQNEAYFQIIINSLKYYQNSKGLHLLGYVIMPTHLHLITYNTEEASLSNIMRDFRQYTSKGIRDLLIADNRNQFLNVFEKAALRLPKQKYKVWKENYHPIAIKSEEWLIEKLNYVHNNPVRKGFVERPEYWKYSSAQNWICDNEKIIHINKECLY